MLRTLTLPVALVALTVSVVAWQGRGTPYVKPVTTRTTDFFRCGEDAVVGMPAGANWDTIALAADSRLYSPCSAGAHNERHREIRDAQLLADASRNSIPEIRRLAIAAYGRLGRPEFVGTPNAPGILMRALEDAYAPVRREAVSAIADALSGTAVEPDDGGPHPALPDQIPYALAAFERLLRGEKDDSVAAMILETLGRLKYGDDETRDTVESTMVAYGNGAPVRVLGVVKGLESLTRANARRPIQPATRDLLRMLATTGRTTEPVPTMSGRGSAEVPGELATLARVRRLAMQTLETARDDDPNTLMKVARDADWQVRRFAARRINPEQADMAGAWQELSSDRAFQVRFEVGTVEARLAKDSHDCTALLKAIDDPVPIVAMHAMDGVPTGCKQSEIVDKLSSFAGQVGRSSVTNWQVPTRAVVALARIKGPLGPFLPPMITHGAWQVRAAAATIVGQLGKVEDAQRLAGDRDPNVRTAALQALVADKSDRTIALQIQALGNADHQLVMTAANVMKGTPAAHRDEVVNALLLAYARETKAAWDTSRDPRMAIVQRLQELLTVDTAEQLRGMNDDFDPRIRTAVTTAYRNIVHEALPPSLMVLHRYPLPPTPEDLQALPTRASIQLAGLGMIEIELLTSQAPVTVARFAELVRARYYDGLTFHRVVPNFVIQGGSPNANEYSGGNRYWRDEVGTEPHTRGAVGISTRGHDTGDGQIFIDLVDVPRLDHDYTVFARVISGLDVADRVVEGSRIQVITVR